MTQIFQIPNPQIFDTTVLSPDGQFVLVYGPDRPAVLYRTTDSQSEKELQALTLPKELLVTAAAFNRGNYQQDFKTRKCALIAESTLVVLDLTNLQISSSNPLRNTMLVTYGLDNTIFVGTTDGAIIMLVEQNGELLTVGRPLKISEYGIIHFAASPRQADYVAVYTDDGKLYSVQAGTGHFSPVDTAEELSGYFGSMAFHPYLSMFTLWKTSGEVSISTPPSQVLHINLPEEYTEQQLLSVQSISENLLLVTTTLSVTEIKFKAKSGSSEAILERQRVIYEAAEPNRIVAVAQLSRSPAADCVVITTVPAAWT
ncbi:hypothetical protein BH10CYA1_BH10CYA1_63410 [soil metagenome]